MNQEMGKWIIFAGIGIVVIGIVFYFFSDKLGWIGNLPGDIRYKGENSSFYFPITTMILFSILLNVIMRLVRYLGQ